MREYGSNINLPSLDNLFSSEQERQDAKLEKIQILPLTELHPFRNHPFQVRDDDEMDKMVDSIKEYGVMTPAIVRPRQDGGYEIVAGHRRCHASQRAGVETMPCIVRDMDDDTNGSGWDSNRDRFSNQCHRTDTNWQVNATKRACLSGRGYCPNAVHQPAGSLYTVQHNNGFPCAAYRYFDPSQQGQL